MRRDTIPLEDAVSTISHEYLLEFTLEYYIPESLHPELPRPEKPIVEFPKGKVGVYTKFFNLKTISREGSGCHGPPVNKRRRKRAKDKVKANALPKVLRKDHAAFRSTQSTIRGKSLAPLGSSKKTTTKIPSRNVATRKAHGMFSAKSPESEKSTFFPSRDGSTGGGDGFSTKSKIRTRGQIAEESQSQDSQMGLEDPSEGRRGAIHVYAGSDRGSSLGYWARPAPGHYEVCLVPRTKAGIR
nr:hypothetical protein [Tanacetum cinerariifolium]